MATVHDVAEYVLAKTGPISAVKLQKLCYFAYGCHLGWEGRRLFDARFEAWANGPVAPDLYARHRGHVEVRQGQIGGDPTALDGNERESIDIVLENFAECTPYELSEMTHQQGPWLIARERAESHDDERTPETLLDDDIKEFFAQLVTSEDG